MAATEQQVQEFVHKAFGDIGGALTASLVVIGDKLGLYRALAGGRRLDPGRAGGADRDRPSATCASGSPAQAAAGYVTYDADDRALHAARRARGRAHRRGEPGLRARRLPGHDRGDARRRRRSIEAFRTGERRRLARARPRPLRRHRALLPARLQRPPRRRVDPGARRRRRRSSSAARASPTSAAGTAPRPSSWRRRSRARRSSASTTTGLDRARASERAATRRRRRPRHASRSRRRRTIPGPATTWSPSSTACTTWATRSARRATCAQSLAPDGTWMLVEPFANDHVEDNLNPLGRVFYSVSTLVCTPASLSQEVGPALGAQAGEARLRTSSAGRLHARPPRHRDAVQPGARGAAVGYMSRA